MWWNKYTNIPFKEKGRDSSGLDCWGLVSLVYKNELGIELPDYLEHYDNTLERKIAGVIEEQKQTQWREVTEPKEFDCILLRQRGVPMHVGIVTKKNRFIHAYKDIGVCHPHSNAPEWRNLVMGYYRYGR